MPRPLPPRTVVQNVLEGRLAAGSATADRQVELLEQLLERLHKLEGRVASTAQQQEMLSRQQQRLETVTVESLSSMRNGMQR